MKNRLLALFIGLVLLSGCESRKDTIHIATKPMSEQFILGEMLALLIEENSDLHVKITKGVGGGTSNIHPAMVKGDFDLYPEYTGTGWLVILKKDSLLPPGQLFSELQKEYSREYGLKWVAPYGFNNAYSLAVSNEMAKKYNLKTFSDLALYPDLFTFGAEYDFYEINDGYADLCAYYNLKFKKNLDMDIGLKYEAMKSGKIDVINIFTTDGQLSHANLTTLKDDKHFFPSYYCATIVREETLKEHPELERILEKMNGILTDQEMADMNYKVDVEHRTEREVAVEFLKKKGLLNPQLSYGK
ncbi:MAG: glycine/betaine ABC transporter substrate-binding protein [Butyricimonas sp.]|nr:glycine/betaine ABC transporter substrate-binding protein [Butyricimonas sp.]MBR5462826.1 glycine/betaine ABC transporter substrate-binding protein [Butyricimonas sp.]MBS5624032.1 glycine/betaine ABC transporter substrate-binding protein [Porphyromonadaceae bacterium]